MSPPTSELFSVQDIPAAGRGVVATQRMGTETLVLVSAEPAVHVIFRQYRKEVCAQCFVYDRGRTLAIRDSTTRKVFCSLDCQQEWIGEQGAHGLGAWRALQTFLSSKAKTLTNISSEITTGPKADAVAIRSAWQEVESQAALLRTERCTIPSVSGCAITAERKQRKASRPHASQQVEPDILGFLLSGILYHHQRSRQWDEDILALASDPTPYTTAADLETHCNSFLQLATILPPELLTGMSIEVCQTVVRVGSHNAFGIRSQDDVDGEEYMGYALYPSASYFNHSCCPNISKKRIGRAWHFTTSSDVQTGEQLCISYLGGDEKDMTLTERRSRLSSVWGFDCMCEICTREDAG